MDYDKDKYELHLAAERQKRGLSLSFKNIVFDPSKHRRDLTGKFAKMIGSLKSGDSVSMPDGTTVSLRRGERGDLTVLSSGKRHQFVTRDPKEAANAAIMDSKESEHPKSIGGPAKKDSTRPDRATEVAKTLEANGVMYRARDADLRDAARSRGTTSRPKGATHEGSIDIQKNVERAVIKDFDSLPLNEWTFGPNGKITVRGSKFRTVQGPKGYAVELPDGYVQTYAGIGALVADVSRVAEGRDRGYHKDGLPKPSESAGSKSKFVPDESSMADFTEQEVQSGAHALGEDGEVKPEAFDDLFESAFKQWVADQQVTKPDWKPTAKLKQRLYDSSYNTLVNLDG